MGDTIVTWTWPNWLTVGFMALSFIAIAGFCISLYSTNQAAPAKAA